MANVEMPTPGEVVADLPTFKQWIGARTATDDAVLSDALTAATEAVYAKVTDPAYRAFNVVQWAVLTQGSRWYKRRQSPEGVAGFGGEGAVVRILLLDPDVEEAIEPYVDYQRWSGIA